MQVAFRQLMVREAVATPFAADDPYCEPGGGEAKHAEMVRVPVVIANFTLRTHRAVIGVPDICGINVSVPDFRTTLRLSDIYNILLAMNRLRAFSRSSPMRTSPQVPGPRLISVAFTLAVTRTQALIHLPAQQKLYFRLHGFECRLPSSGTKVVRVAKLFCFVRPPKHQETWQEFIRIDDGSFHLPLQPAHPLHINVDGGARIRVPHGFVLNEFVRGVSVAVKGLKHLVHIVRSGLFAPMSPPSAEGPKTVPLVQVRVRTLTFEVADDPMESKLSLLWRAGAGAARVRMERDDAFLAKVAAINGELEEETSRSNPKTTLYHFDDRHTISVNEARDRLLQVHALDWMERYRKAAEARATAEEAIQSELWGEDTLFSNCLDGGSIVTTGSIRDDPPLLRFMIKDLHLNISPPSFDAARLPDYLFERGNGMPRDMEYSLLIPLHLHISLASARLSVREYPLPLFNIPERNDGQASLDFDTDLVIAEEMGTDQSVEWVDCNLVDRDTDIYHSASFSFKIPKTIMPVKTYADPVVAVHAEGITDFTWGVSFAPVTQDLLRAIDTFTSAPRDPSPPVGFWDKVLSQSLSVENVLTVD
jgi:hypothetical protein